MNAIDVIRENKGKVALKVGWSEEKLVIETLVNYSNDNGFSLNIFCLGYKYTYLKEHFPNITYPLTKYYSFDTSSVDMCIIPSLDYYHESYQKSIARCKSKWMVGFVDSKLPVVFNDVLKLVELDTNTMYSESNLIFQMKPEDKEKFDRYTEIITDGMGIFNNDISILEKCIDGDKVTGLTPYACRLQYAEEKGWTHDIDTSIPFFKKVDECFNPETLYETASNVRSTIVERKRLLEINNERVTVTALLINKLLNEKKRVVVSYYGSDFPAKLEAELVRLGYPTVLPLLYNGMPKRIILEHGEPIVYKSGNKAAEPKLFAEQALGKHYSEQFNANALQPSLLGIYGGVDKSIPLTNIDVLVVASGSAMDYYSCRKRLARFTFKANITIYRVLHEGKELMDVEALQKKFRINAKTFSNVNDIIND